MNFTEFVRKPASRKRCGRASGCKQPGDWEVQGQPEHGRWCLTHMLESLDRDRRHNIGCDGHGNGKPALCGGYRFCLGLGCYPACSDRMHCRALVEPVWWHIRLAVPYHADPERAWAKRYRRNRAAKRRALRA